MSEIYDAGHRTFQDQFQTRGMADRLEELIVHEEIDEKVQSFIESRDMFFLSTVSADGQPSVSYKGGDAGFVKVVSPRVIAFPSYDGNGMFYSLGNLANRPNVGLLFIDFETPHRIRLHGRASIRDDDPLLSNYVEADLAVRVEVSKLWVNCPRYIHRYVKQETSRYVPRAERQTPHAQWKRIDLVQDVLAPKDVGRADEVGGAITIEEYMGKVSNGDG